MRLATVSQCREVDRMAMEVYGLSGEVLMESAGALAAREIDQSFYPELQRGLTSIVCGPGNNGGDGLVLARHLHSAGHRDVVAFVLAPEGQRSELFKVQLHRAELHGLRVVDVQASPEKLEQIKSSSLLIDALFGIGLSRPLEGEWLQLVDLMNSVRAPLVALDAPSGLDCDRGVVLGAVAKADMTLAFGLARPGFFTADGPHNVGRLRVLPIGYPFECLRGVATSHFAFTEKLARRYLPRYGERSNKTDHGRLLVLAGSEGHWGAGVLAAGAAYRVGAGLVTWASFDSPHRQIVDAPEILTDVISEELVKSNHFQAVAVGPGLGINEETAKVIKWLKQSKAQVVLDADAITACVNFNLFPLPESWVLTPHAGELARVIGMETSEIEKGRYHAALLGHKKSGAHVSLKGYRSILAY